MIAPLSEAELETALGRLPGWTVEQQNDGAVELVRTFEFPSFEDAMRFMATAAHFISETDHHPAWTNEYKNLRVRLTTWDAGRQISARDIRLAEYFDRLYAGQGT